METNTVSRMIWNQAAFSFRREHNLREGLSIVRERPNILDHRIEEFDTVIKRMNDLMTCTEIPEQDLTDVGRLKGILPDNFMLPSLSSLAEEIVQGKTGGLTLFAQSEIFSTIRNLIESGDWGYIRNLRHPGTLASALLIEGYGQMLDRYFEIDGLNRAFVLAFEEVMWHEFRIETALLRDVFPWLVEERASFPPGMRREIERLYLFVNSSWFFRWTSTPIAADVPPEEYNIVSLGDFGYTYEHFEAIIVQDSTTSVLIRLTETASETTLESTAKEILEFLQEKNMRLVAKSDTGYDRNITFIDICLPASYRLQMIDLLKGKNISGGYIDISTYDRGQVDIAELVWVSSR
ncbi:MAG: hypothetical protein PHS44_02650 [Candidatus Dojkabacteria bacterium]|nr:hypothetical protein [Candidatus Dojkabacteria bacterium]